MTEYYPGIHFVPPDGTVDPRAEEGEGVVRWARIDGKYTFVQFEGKPLDAPDQAPQPPLETPEAELDRMAGEGIRYARMRDDELA